MGYFYRLTLSRSDSQERGSAAIEYAGVLFIIAALLLSIFIAIPSPAQKLACTITSAVSQALGAGPLSCADGNGESDPKAEDPHKPDKPCTTEERKREAAAGASIPIPVLPVVDGVADMGEGIVVKTMSDGTYQVTDTNTSAGGVAVGKGKKGALYLGDEEYNLGADAGLSGELTGSQGVTYSVNSAEDRDALVNYLTRKKTLDTGGRLIDQGTGWAGGLANWTADQVDGYDPPKPTEGYGEAGAKQNAHAGPGNGTTTDAGGPFSASQALGTKLKADGTTTAYYKGNGELTGAARSLENDTDWKGTANEETVVAVKYDKNGNTVGLELSLTAQGAAGAPDKNMTGKVQTLSVDMTSDQARKAGAGLLSIAGIPSNLGGSNATAEEGLEAFRQAVKDTGKWTVQDVTTDNDKYGADFVVGSATYTDQTATYSNGKYMGADGKFHDWGGGC